MKKILFVSLGLFFLFQRCKNEQRVTVLESPLSAVIKMQSAERLLEFEEAKKYADVNSIYKDPGSDSVTGEDIWRSMLIVENNMSKSKKLSNQFKYFDYDITESVKAKTAEVIFTSKSDMASIQKIIYKLVLGRENWVVSSIGYKKNRKSKFY